MINHVVTTSAKQALMNLIQCYRDQSLYLDQYIESMKLAKEICCSRPDDVMFSDGRVARLANNEPAEFSDFGGPQ